MNFLPPNPSKWLKNRTLPLLIALVALIGLHPLFLLSNGDTNNLFPGLVVCVPLFGVIALTNWKRSIPLVVLFVVMVTLCWLIYGFDQVDVARSPIAYIASAYYIYAIIALASEMLTNESLIDDRVYGGISIYLMAAMMFSSIHRHVSAVDPNAYYLTLGDKPTLLLWNDAIYFSITTITTVGFGDIIPMSPWARATCMLEAIVGVFITIVFIARLASLPSKPTNQKH
ncbi:MAG: potassium channel family protein [Planctomycetota bacterium]